MVRSRRTPSWRGWVPALLATLAWSGTNAAIVKNFDRKFPEGLCPMETRSAAGVDPSFLAPASTVRLTFSVRNYTSGNHNFVHLDNVVVVPKAVFDSHLVVTPGYELCYDPVNIPPGQATGGILNAPAYDFNAAGTPEVLLDRFDNDESGWSGVGVFYDDSVAAPTNPVNGTGATGGSLALGRDVDGDVTIHASKIVSGLTAGAEYVVVAWWFTFNTPPLTIEIDVPPCNDFDSDTYADCSITCDLLPGQICGDCDDTDPAIHPAAPDAHCDGIDNDCDGQADEGFPGGCLCTMPAPGLASWWPGDGSPNDVRGTNHGSLLNGATYAVGQAGQAFSLDGVDDYVRVAHSATLDPGAGSFSVAAWVRTSVTGVNQTVFSKYECGGLCPAGASSLYSVSLAGDGRPFLDLRDAGHAGATQSISGAGSIADGAWHHVAASRDMTAGTLNLYVDGVLVALSGLASVADGVIGDTDGEPDPLLIGAQFVGGTNTAHTFFSGRIDEALYFNRALGQSEIRAMHAAGPVALCRCADGDWDGHGAAGGLTCPAGTLQDCNDADASIHPGAPELCNGADDDCDATIDEGLSQTTFYRDVDADGYGAAATTIQACAVPPGYAANSTDCNDANASIHPGASDTGCDGVDQNCSGAADENFISPPYGWIATPLSGAPSARRFPTMVSTGNSVIVWGGFTATNTGGIYRPGDAATDTWSPTSLTNAPSARYYHSAVWTGTEMIVWGGLGGGNTGGLYNPSTDTWAVTTLTNAPAARQEHSAVWTGTHMVVWGGSLLNTGGAYQPGAFGGTWTALPTTGAPGARSGHTAVWTGNYMVVWGGYNGGTYYNTGGRYSPSSNTWSTMAASPLAGRSRHSVVWTGSKMIVWGGYSGGSPLTDGAIYDPQLNTWAPITATGPAARYSHTAVWDPTAGRMVIWGGFTPSGPRNDGWAYDPQANAWTPLPTTGAPSASYDHAAAWLSATREMVVWGGWGPPIRNTGGRIVVAPFQCGVGSCTRPSSYTCVASQLGYGCTPGAPTAEVCNGIDDDCNATPDDGISAPSGQPVLALTRIDTEGVLYWTPVDGATGYDVVRGGLLALRASAGDFTTSTTNCVEDDTANLYASEGSLPSPGDATWVLVRAVNACGGNGTYDEAAPSQQGSRDAEIAASPVHCP